MTDPAPARFVGDEAITTEPAEGSDGFGAIIGAGTFGIANAAALRMPQTARLYSDIMPIVGLVGCATLGWH